MLKYVFDGGRRYRCGLKRLFTFNSLKSLLKLNHCICASMQSILVPILSSMSSLYCFVPSLWVVLLIRPNCLITAIVCNYFFYEMERGEFLLNYCIVCMRNCLSHFPFKSKSSTISWLVPFNHIQCQICCFCFTSSVCMSACMSD